MLGLGGGIFVARRVLRRIDAMTGTTQRIMAGDLSGRLPVGRSGDELDRLAENLNAMLERIEALMSGLKEVSDNIAHDLKTPLTRLRNRAEEALAKSGSEADYRAALERTIEESDGLIRTFNALLMIARAESGQARGDMDDFDAADIARGIHELYEPLAEDNGLTLRIEAEPAPLHGNRELISQALANLVENAIKYGQPHRRDAAAESRRGAARQEILIEARRDGDQVLLSVTDHGPRHSGSRPQARGGALRAARGQPDPAGLGPRPQPRRRRWRRCMAANCGSRDAQPGTARDACNSGPHGRCTGCSNTDLQNRRRHDLFRDRRGRTIRTGRAFCGRTASALRPTMPHSRLDDWLGDLAPAQAAAIRDIVGRSPQRRDHAASHRRSLALSVRPDARRSPRALIRLLRVRSGAGIWPR